MSSRSPPRARRREGKAGVGSAVNDATRETGGALGVAVIGSVYTSLYLSHISSNPSDALPRVALDVAQHSVGAGYALAHRLPSPFGYRLQLHVEHAFMAGLHAGSYVAAGVCAIGVLGAIALPGPAHPT